MSKGDERFGGTASDANRTYYVSGSGDDSNDGSIGSPFLTLQRAIDEVSAIDEIAAQAARKKAQQQSKARPK